ncbi:MAG: hypothetical protein HC843_00690 [Sphingomonadales bacterium]|nr:hypothetical protein [Sphingomonadales bacterium]
MPIFSINANEQQSRQTSAIGFLIARFLLFGEILVLQINTNCSSKTARIEKQHRSAIIWQRCAGVKARCHNQRRTGFHNQFLIVNDRRYIKCKGRTDGGTNDD